ncbi:hypothetical protein Tco_0535843 [Tanacetum coccineum]
MEASFNSFQWIKNLWKFAKKEISLENDVTPYKKSVSRCSDNVMNSMSELDLSCKYATRIQEWLVYVQDTYPNAITPSAKKVTVKPMNNLKKVRFAEPLTSSSKIQQVESSNTSDSNTPVLSSTGVKCSTSNYGSKPPEHVEFNESDTYVLERFDTLAGNPVNEILLKLNLPDSRIFKDGGEGT